MACRQHTNTCLVAIRHKHTYSKASVYAALLLEHIHDLHPSQHPTCVDNGHMNITVEWLHASLNESMQIGAHRNEA